MVEGLVDGGVCDGVWLLVAVDEELVSGDGDDAVWAAQKTAVIASETRAKWIVFK